MDKRHTQPMTASTSTNIDGRTVFTSLTHGAAALYLLEKAGKTINDVHFFCSQHNIEIMTAGNGDKWYTAEALNRTMYGA